MAEAKGIKSAEQSPVQLQTQMQVIDSVVSRIQASNQNLMNIQAETNHLLSTLNNNIIAISNNQNYSVDAKHIQLLNELQAITQAQAGSCQIMQRMLEKPNDIVFPYNLFEDILCELRAVSDEGELRYISGTATGTPVEYNFVTDYDPHHPVRQIIIANDGADTIQIAINEPDTAHFIDVAIDETQHFPFRKAVINRVFIKSSSSVSFRLWYLW